MTHEDASGLSGFLRQVRFDQALLWGLSVRLVAALTGPVTTFLIAYCFTAELQGFHYTFVSLLGMQRFVELGLSGVLVTFASHEWAGLRRTDEGGVAGDALALSRLAGLVSFGLRWFMVAAGLLVLALVVGGVIFFRAAPAAVHHAVWQGPWIGLCLATGISLTLVPVWAILQGCGQIQQVYFCRFVESLVLAVVTAVAILAGAGLYASVIGTTCMLCWSGGFLWTRYRRFFASVWQHTASESISWKHDILPLQWRIGLSWVSGYFVFSLFTPALFHFQGPVAAGQMGMTWSLIGGISGLAGTWLQVKVPHLGALIAQRRFRELDRVVWQASVIAVGAAGFGGAALLLLVGVLERWAPALRGRLLPTLPIVIFLAAEVLHQISMGQSTYLRAFKREPFLVMSIVSGLIVGVSTIAGAGRYGATGISIGYFAVVLISLVWGTRVFVQCRDEWTVASEKRGEH